MGDFLGFTFNGVHSTDLGIIRISDGSRYKDTLYPEIKDLTAEIPNKNGEYYFGSTYNNRNFSLEIAYDSMTEEQLRRLRETFKRSQIGSLIFDEEPYKKYLVKLENAIELSYICFDEPRKTIGTMRDGVRVIDRTDGIVREQVKPYVTDYSQTQRMYKGEGTIDLIGYYPFAKSCFKILPTEDYDNVNEWADASKILDTITYHNYDGQGFDKIFMTENNYKMYVYNGGDIETGCRIYCPFRIDDTSYIYDKLEIIYSPREGAEIQRLVLENVVKSDANETDKGFLINTENGLIQGVESINYDMNGNSIITTSTSLYNKYITAGEFFKLQPNLTYTDNSSIIFNGGNEAIQIFYDYLYF